MLYAFLRHDMGSIYNQHIAEIPYNLKNGIMSKIQKVPSLPFPSLLSYPSATLSVLPFWLALCLCFLLQTMLHTLFKRLSPKYCFSLYSQILDGSFFAYLINSQVLKFSLTFKPLPDLFVTNFYLS